MNTCQNEGAFFAENAGFFRSNCVFSLVPKNYNGLFVWSDSKIPVFYHFLIVFVNVNHRFWTIFRSSTRGRSVRPAPRPKSPFYMFPYLNHDFENFLLFLFFMKKTRKIKYFIKCMIFYN